MNHQDCICISLLVREAEMTSNGGGVLVKNDEIESADGPSIGRGPGIVSGGEGRARAGMLLGKHLCSGHAIRVGRVELGKGGDNVDQLLAGHLDNAGQGLANRTEPARLSCEGAVLGVGPGRQAGIAVLDRAECQQTCM